MLGLGLGLGLGPGLGPESVCRGNKGLARFSFRRRRSSVGGLAEIKKAMRATFPRGRGLASPREGDTRGTFPELEQPASNGRPALFVG
jgi:hypothetical protein